MAESSVFDLLGPVMVGPSSSHTAGAVRLGLMARKILGEQVQKAGIVLHGSFAETGKGHGTHLALTAGILGMQPDDEGIRRALQIAREKQLEVKFEKGDLGETHPNTAKICLTGLNGKRIEMTGSSIGGGMIVIREINQFPVEFNGEYPAIVSVYADYPGMIAEITAVLAKASINIAKMKVSREGRGKRALTVIETDDIVPIEVLGKIRKLAKVEEVIFIEPMN
ncbi:L-serine ammonia-lyase [Syntrophobotulus glycolicus DSM 8271]|uniref:L-serine deaminase n=1 Tax=Syntrophobotulus glycolicus (strain DSM 8271 / FlGlyR) TaxID=645991 RepID=F0SUG4_SYNGF|nr:L-serine ammonia-lyase, iron-sulfur-dependent subunit beta [Syntrophobotulus glycolicus]ADY56614.1 L-serine ammonia-lyase [Syntrophobotulus glycolicus DSM 8271]